MTVAITHTARAAADRAHALAAVLTARALDRPDTDTFRTVAAHLGTAAHAFETEEPFYFEGVAVTNCFPADASMALLDADCAAEDDPAHPYLRDVVRYVSAPITRTVPELPSLNPRDEVLAYREIGISTRIGVAAYSLDTASTDGTRRAIFADLLDLHQEFAQLADAVAADKARAGDR